MIVWMTHLNMYVELRYNPNDCVKSAVGMTMLPKGYKNSCEWHFWVGLLNIFLIVFAFWIWASIPKSIAMTSHARYQRKHFHLCQSSTIPGDVITFDVSLEWLLFDRLKSLKHCLMAFLVELNHFPSDQLEIELKYTKIEIYQPDRIWTSRLK